MNKILSLIKEEEKRQRETLMMIPSENYTYPEVRQAVGSVLMHKYSEGQPHKRYYQGNFIIDEIEELCKKYALEAFSLSPAKWAVNVQPYSGSAANLAVYNAFLQPGDEIMAMHLTEGGHLSHGWHLADKKVTLTSKIWDVEFYHLDPKTLVFNYQAIEKQAKKVRPKLIISGGTAYPREIEHDRMAKVAKSVAAYYLADVAHEAGLIAGGANKSPFSYADVVTMTSQKTLRGPRGALIFSRKELAPKIDSSVFPGLQGGPQDHTIAGIAIALKKAQSKSFKDYSHQVVANAQKLAKRLLENGFNLVSGGTDKHLILIDLANKGINGWFVAWALEKAGIIVNRNTVPCETSSAYYPSGLRLGTPAITVRGMKEKEMEMISQWINQVVEHLGQKSIPQDKEKRNQYLQRFKSEIEKDVFLKKIRQEVLGLCKKFPIDF